MTIMGFIKFLLATLFSVAFSFFTHKIIDIPELYFVFGAINAVVVMIILKADL